MRPCEEGEGVRTLMRRQREDPIELPAKHVMGRQRDGLAQEDIYKKWKALDISCVNILQGRTMFYHDHFPQCERSQYIILMSDKQDEQHDSIAASSEIMGSIDL